MQNEIDKEVEKYIMQFSSDLQAILMNIRDVIMESDSHLQERIGYGMPGYYLDGPVIYFAANKAHIGLYPGPATIEHFKEELKAYETSKGTIRFKDVNAVPYDLIQKMTMFRIEQNKLKKAMKKKK